MRGLLVIAGLLALPGAAFAQQTDYSAGKTPAQLFSGDCSACHQSPRGLAKGKDQSSLANFLREHYTTKAETAGSLAAYLLSNPGTASEPRNVTGRTPRGTPASAPAAAAPAPKPADDDPFRRIFRTPSAEPETDEGSIAAPEPGDKQKGKPRTAARPPAERSPADAAKEKEKAREQAKEKEKEKETAREAARETARPKKPDPAGEAAKAEAARAEEAAREAAAKEAAVKAEAAKAEAAKVRSYMTGGETAAPAPEKPASTPPS